MADCILRRCPACGSDKPESEFFPRRVTNRCRPCLAEYKRQHYIANAEAYKERAKQARLRDVEAYRAAAKARSKSDPKAPLRKAEYKQRHKERVKAQAAQYRIRHADHIRESIKDWRSRNKHKLCHYAAVRRVAKGRATPKWSNQSIVESLYGLAAVWSKAMGIQYEVDHIIPIQHPLVCGLHCEANLQVLPMSANRRKSNKIDV